MDRCFALVGTWGQRVAVGCIVATMAVHASNALGQRQWVQALADGGMAVCCGLASRLLRQWVHRPTAVMAPCAPLKPSSLPIASKNTGGPGGSGNAIAPIACPERKAISCFSAYRLCCRPRYMTNGCRAYPQAKEGRMDHYSLLYSLRSRAGQFLTWLIGSTQTRQQYQQSDRQQADGFLRSQDDPDARQRQAFTPDAGLTLRERFQAWAGHQAHQSDTQEHLRQHLDAQQRQQQQQQRQQRGGWGYGR